MNPGRYPAKLLDLVSLGAGALLSLAFAPLGWFPLAPLALTLWFITLSPATPRRALVRGLLFGIGSFGLGVNWVHISIHQYGHSSLAMAWGAAALLILFLSLFPAVVAWVANRWQSRIGLRRLLLVLPAGWILAEWVRSWLFTGFPWLSVGYSQIEGPLAGYAPLLGESAVGLATLLTAGILAHLLLVPKRRVLLSGLLVVLWVTGYLLTGTAWTRPAGSPLDVSLVQGNIDQEQKWNPAQRIATLERYLGMTRSEWYGDPTWSPDLVVWPETAIPAFYHQVEDSFIPQLQRETRAASSALLVGVPVLERESWTYYNAVLATNPSPAFYYKRHLVPFGEYLPLRDWLGGLLEVMPLPVADFSSGGDDQSLLKVAGYPVGISVCYEVIFGEEVRDTLPEAAFLVNVSNDAWFGDSWAPHQHLEMARMRALETGRFMLRATNTGISAVIDPFGNLDGVSPQFEPAVVRGSIMPLQGATPYVRWGSWPVLLLAVGMCVAGIKLGRGK